MMRSKTLFMGLAAMLLSMSIAPTASAHTSGQHGPLSGHLLGSGAWGNIQFVGKVRVQDAEEGLIADVSVFGNYAYLARWGGSQCAGPEKLGQQLADAVVNRRSVAPAALDDLAAQAVQRAAAEALGQPLAGWKVGATSPAAQANFGTAARSFFV